MSRLVFVDDGETAVLGAYIAIANIGGGLTVRLFTNDVTAGLTPAEVDQLETADFTEATFAGYAAVSFTTGWTTTAGNPSESVNVARTFTRSSTGTAQLVHGYYVTDVGATGLQWFEQFDAPISVEFLNDQVIVTPRFTLDDVGGNGMPTGSMVLWGVDAAGDVPSGWLLCDGSAVSRSTFADLFAVIGIAFGVGDGATTFNLPDMQQRFPLGQAASGTGVNVGDTGGDIDHVHGLDTSSSAALIRPSAGSETMRSSLKTVPSWTPTDSLGSLTAIANAAITQATELTGDSDTANPPFLTVNYLVKT